MKFAHFSDVHLGSWGNHPDLREYPQKAFSRAVEECIACRVDFIVIGGDLFDTSIPPIDTLKQAAAKLKQCCDNGIRVYLVPGSHDFSPTGKTMLSVLEEAGLLTDVAKYNEDGGKIKPRVFRDEAGASICGLPGKAGALEKSLYENLDIPDIDGFSVFIMHSGIDRINPDLRANVIPFEHLPKKFNYYANGHVHKRQEVRMGHGIMVFPGPLFPAGFDELENYASGMYIVNVEGNAAKTEWKEVKLFDVILQKVDAQRKTAMQVEEEIMNSIENQSLNNKILLLRIEGILETGNPSDIDFSMIAEKAKERGAIAVKRNTNKLEAKTLAELEIEEKPIEDIEKEIVKKHALDMPFGSEELVINLISVLSDEKKEGETNATFEKRISDNALKLMVG